jgi:NADPH:quinone reductase-like Zn-dependent oxidoreductase
VKNAECQSRTAFAAAAAINQKTAPAKRNQAKAAKPKNNFHADVKEQVMSTDVPVLKKTMRAVFYDSFGGPEVIRYEEVAVPQPGKGEILVEVHAAGVNPVDWKIRGGYRRENFTLPLIPGWDFSGVVAAKGTEADDFEIGDEVYSRPDINRHGAYAEYIVVRQSEVARKPESLDHIAAAAVPLACLTAWQSLFDAADLQEGQKVLIHAAAGGVGHFAVQLAKYKNAYVIGTASKEHNDFVRQLGADEVIDYKATKFEKEVKDVDVVFDTIGGETQRRSWKVLKKGGIQVTILKPPSKAEAEEHGARVGYVFVQPNREQLTEIAKLIDDGVIKPAVEAVFPLSEAAEAQELSQAGHTAGKIVLQVI